VAERPVTKGGGAGDQGVDPHPISRGMEREAGREARPAVEEPREGATTASTSDGHGWASGGDV
jgi:hypothetical protein